MPKKAQPARNVDHLEPDWTLANLANPALRLFYQRWMELLDARTPVSQQASVFGAPALVRELHRLHEFRRTTQRGAGELLALHQEAFGVKVSGAEIAGTLTEDPILRTTGRDLVSLFENAKSHLGGKAQEAVAAGRIEALSRAVAHELDRTYLRGLCDLIRSEVQKVQAVSALNETAAVALDELAAALATECLAVGYAPSFLRLLAHLFASPKRPENDRLDRFLTRLLEPEREITIVIKAQASADFWAAWPSVEAPAKQLLTDVPEVPSEGGHTTSPDYLDFAQAAPGGVETRFTCITTPARDHHAAAQRAYEQFQRYADYVFAEVPDRKLVVLRALAVREEGGAKRLSYASREELSGADAEPVRRSARAATHAGVGFAARLLAAGAETRTVRRLAGALRFYRISLVEGRLESGFPNLWTALEVLAHEGYGEGEYTIDRVVRSVAPLVASFKARDLSDDMLAYLRHAGALDLPAFAAAFPELAAAEASPHLVVGALSDRARVETLCALLPDNPLLQRRVRAYHAAVRTGHELRTRVIRTMLRVEWQIRRLYGARNGVVHGADLQFTSARLLEHLRLYTSTTILTVARIVSSGVGIRTIEDALGVVDAELQHWLTRVHSKELAGPVAGAPVEALAFLYRPAFERRLPPA